MSSLTNGVFTESACSADTSSVYKLATCYWAGTTPTCRVVIAQSPVYGKVLFLDDEIQSAESDEAIYHEHLVHPAMATAMATVADAPNKHILIVGGGEGATCREVLKWPTVEHVDWVDIDGPLVDLCRQHLSWASDSVYTDPRVTYYSQDIRKFLDETDKQYDVILLDLPDPDVDTLTSSANEHMLYGRPFWESIRAHSRGVVASHVGPVAPGDKSGLQWVTDEAKAVGFGPGFAYHATIPSFQSEWGFWMSHRPASTDVWPESLSVMSSDTQQYAFTWPRYWYKA
jgi:spermidine synthase